MGRVGFWGRTKFSERYVVSGSTKYVRPGMRLTQQNQEVPGIKQIESFLLLS